MEDNRICCQSVQDILATLGTPVNKSFLTIDTSALTVNPTVIATTNCNPWEQLIEDKLKEYCSSTDKHLDDLEEDIDFLNEMRKEMNNTVAYHDDMIGQYKSDIAFLKDENALLHGLLNNLQNQIYEL